MGGYRTVLVGTDGSQTSYRAVDRAAEVAAASGATLLLACAYRPQGRRDAERAQRELGQEAYSVSAAYHAEEVLSDARGRATRAGAQQVEAVAVEGDPVDVLLRLAAEREVDLVVVGNRGLNSLAGRVLGSVPANISHRAPSDVLIVHTTSGR